MDHVKVAALIALISIMTILVAPSNELPYLAIALSQYKSSNNVSIQNSVSTGDNIVPFSTLSNLSSGSPHPIKAECFLHGFVANNKPLGDLLIIKFRNDGSCNPTIELFATLGTVLGIIPAGGDSLKLGYDGLVFIKYIETPPKATAVVH